MKFWWIAVFGLIVIGVSITCVGLGWWAGRSAAQQMSIAVNGMPIAAETVSSQTGSRLRLYYGSQIDGRPAYTFVEGEVYREDSLHDPVLTLRNGRVYAGDHPEAPLLFHFEGDRIVEGAGEGPVRFVQQGNTIRISADLDSPPVFTFAGTHIYRGTVDDGYVIATTNAVPINADLVKLMALIVYMDTLE
jgi:hypothetical protein